MKKKNLNIPIPEELHIKLKLKATEQSLTMRQYIPIILEEALRTA